MTGKVADAANVSTSATVVGNAAAAVGTECSEQISYRPRLLASRRDKAGATRGVTNHSASSASCSATSTAASSSVGTTTVGLPIRRPRPASSSSSVASGSVPTVGATKRPAAYRETAAGVNLSSVIEYAGMPIRPTERIAPRVPAWIG